MTLKTPGLMLLVSLVVIAVFQSTHRTVMAAGAESLRAVGRVQQIDTSGPRTGIVAFLLSPRGRQIVRASNHPMARSLMRRLGEESQATAPVSHPVRQTSLSSSGQPPAASIGCGTATGTTCVPSSDGLIKTRTPSN